MPRADKRQRKKENARAAREAREAQARRKKRMRSIRNISIAVVVIVGGLLIFNWLAGDDDDKVSVSDTSTTVPTDDTTPATLPEGCDDTVPEKGEKKTYDKAPELTIDTAKTYVATVDTTCGSFDITLDAANAPQTTNSFVFLAREGFYDGLTFHRLVSDFVIQGGDPDGDGTGGPGYQLPDEPPKDGYKAGSVAMANSGPGTSGSQFFVAVSDNGAQGLGTTPPYKYSSLGQVTQGMETIDKLMQLAPDGDGPPTHPLYIKSITITES